MDPTLASVLSVILTPLTAGFAGLWLYTRQTTNARIAEAKDSASKRVSDAHKTNEARIVEVRAYYERLLTDRESRIEELRSDLSIAVGEVRSLNSIIGRNTDALTQNAQSQEQMVAMLRDLLGTAN